MDISQIKRFTETKPPQNEFQALKDEIERLGYISMCTPFDEPSVKIMLDMNFSIFKVASCSFSDWPLMEEIVKVDKPIVISTAGAQSSDMDNMVSFFKNRKKDFSIMHCVSAYPTKNSDLELNQLDYLKNKYPEISIGYSTHEHPDNVSAVQIAVAKGAMLYEKHVGVPTDKYSLNGYSCTPEQISKWLSAMSEAFEMCGIQHQRMNFSVEGEAALKGLFRGAFAKNNIKKGDTFYPQDTFCAIPAVDGQIIARQLSKYVSFVAKEDIKADQPILNQNVNFADRREIVQKIVLRVKDVMEKAHVTVPYGVNCSAYAHYGIEKFDDTGAVLINILNREYSKTLLIMFPGQRYPLHFHKQKEETFYILSGRLFIETEGTKHHLEKGQMLTVQRDQKHLFYTEEGVILEEIATTYLDGDSYYDDPLVLNSQERRITFGLY
jgi:sialic acid synthase SpsE/mannose-6-phosphate isomerase-like protein (cupin superfamily)